MQKFIAVTITALSVMALVAGISLAVNASQIKKDFTQKVAPLNAR